MIKIKTPAEIELMREPCRIVRDALDLAGRTVKAGMTTKDLDIIIHDYIISQGAKPSCLGYYGYPASTCISVDDMVVHGIPSDEIVIKNGQLVSVDLCAYKNGFHGDGARTFCIGEVSPETKKLVEVTEQCFFKGLEAVGDGVPLGDIGYAVQTHAEANGFSVVRSMVGHGIGREMHEDPNVPNYGKKGTGIRLKTGMVICIEPMINAGTHKVNFLPDGWGVATQDGRPSAHYENTVAITEDGVEILTL
ncbi:MAG: type I methionyl aminopeptidase [Clostridia bacterium]|nr:type I methionyl aminopeptidase [Clostridia bacterium]